MNGLTVGANQTLYKEPINWIAFFWIFAFFGPLVLIYCAIVWLKSPYSVDNSQLPMLRQMHSHPIAKIFSFLLMGLYVLILIVFFVLGAAFVGSEL